MRILSPFKPFSVSFPMTRVASTSTSSPVAQLHGRSPLVRALCVLSIGAISAIAFTTGCAQSHSLFGSSRLFNQASSRALHSAGMDTASTTVPSIVVYVTVPNREAGRKLSDSIVKERLAACVNIVPGVESVYWWEGKVQADSEELLIIKTRESLLPALTEHVKANHEYDLPEVIAMPITGGNTKYLEWIKNSTKDA
ncbi:Divalent-cation tolerance protein CutA [Rhynchospora pubera]|uniref:Divalent-cation tolerance protein CutA n=1 Tax=Rhynchospora pubera TaxID=906938 RepID=A0AAV8HWV3_9POAL|nr:Divalent-cation tolerance protein CutA [Rhynchospora pubera]